MNVGRTNRAGIRNSVVAGSVWESRMKSDEVKGGIKVFKGDDNSDESGGGSGGVSGGVGDDVGAEINRKVKATMSARRKTWQSENSEGINKSPIQLSRGRSDKNVNCDDEQSKELRSLTPVTMSARKTRSETVKDLSISADGIDKSPIPVRRTRSEWKKGPLDIGENVDKIEKDSVQSKKKKSELSKGVEKNGIENIPIEDSLKKDNPNKGIDEIESENAKTEVTDESNEKIKNPIEVYKIGSDENCLDYDMCEEKSITSSFSNVGLINKSDYIDEQDNEEFEEIEKKSIDIKEVNVPEQIPKKLLIQEKVHQFHKKTVPVAPIVNKQPPPVIQRSAFHQNSTKPNSIHSKFSHDEDSYESQRIPRTQNRLQNLVDLIMWRDASRSAFVFGIGTFFIISSSYTKDLNISFISVISYLGLVYLVLIFLYRTIISRGSIDVDGSSKEHVIGEEEAIWILKMLLPYINEFLLHLRTLFSGDPTTTMKLSVVLFISAKCGTSITIWKMAKFGFFGVFIVPKVCSSYSTQLTEYGRFWIQRFRDAWESCTHKKAVAGVIFTLVWNLSSIIARIWALFMLFVAVRCYQQSLNDDEESSCQTQVDDVQRIQAHGPTLVELRKEKKVY